MAHSFSVPIYIKLAKNPTRRKRSRKTKKFKTVKTKTYTLSLNNYSNWNVKLRNSIKKKFYEEIKPALEIIRGDLQLLERTELKTPLQLNLRLWAKNPASDLDNFTSVCSKFLLDALQKEKLLQSDNLSHVVALNYKVQGIDKEYPRMSIEILEKATNWS